jgi:COP9 signalosome complex subunit 3
METRAYASAVQVLDNYIHSLPSKIPHVVASLEYSVPAADHTNSGDYITQKSGHTDKITLQALQEYYVLGAMAYSGVRQFKDARDFLEHVLVMPSTNGACNGLFLEAYQKWVLLSLLVDGSVSRSHGICPGTDGLTGCRPHKRKCRVRRAIQPS